MATIESRSFRRRAPANKYNDNINNSISSSKYLGERIKIKKKPIKDSRDLIEDDQKTRIS